MSVERTLVGHETRYELHDETGLSCVLAYTADPDQPAIWKLLQPGPGNTEDLYSTHQFASPDAAGIEAWLTPLVGSEQATAFADAVDAAPPPPAAWRPRGG